MLLTSTLDLVLSILVVRFIGKFSAGLSKDLRLSMFTKIQHFSTQDFQSLEHLLILIVQQEIFKV